jgi:hypothetical protein
VRSSKRSAAVMSITVSRGQRRHVVVSWGHTAIESEFAQESSLYWTGKSRSSPTTPMVQVAVTELLSLARAAPCASIRVYDDAGNVIETHEHPCEFSEMVA